MSLIPFITTFIMIAVAELGDKTQLLTFGLATKYSARIVIAAVSCASALLMALAVIFGGLLNRFVPIIYIQTIAGILFIAFGFWTILGKEEADDDEAEAKGKRSPFWLVFTAFLLAELGDKTQIATLALTAQYGSPFQVWVGATLAMIAVNTLGALAGKWTKDLIPKKNVKLVGAAIFIMFGLWTLGDLYVW